MTYFWEKKPDLIRDIEPNSKWSVYSSSQNLASVLNDPSLPRNVSENIFVKDWGNNFIESGVLLCPSLLIKVGSHHFDDYCKRISKRNKIALKYLKSTKVEENNASAEKIPRIFMKSDFSLENSNTFKTLLSFSDNSLPSSTPSSPTNWNTSAKESLKELSRKLTDYLDIVEENLSRQISLRFREFFHIMNAMDSVMEQISKTIKEVTLIRKKCKQLEDTLVKPSLKNIQYTRARYNAKLVLEKIKLISKVHQTQPKIQLLLSNSQFVEALDLIESSQEVVSSELRGLNCFRHLDCQLNEIREMIIRMMKEEFIKLISKYWNQPLNICDQLDIQEEDRFRSMVLGMIKNQSFNFIDHFNKEARIAIKAVVKQTVIETLSQEDDGSNEKGLFYKIKDITFNKWISLLNLTFSNLLLLFKKFTCVHRWMMKVAEEASEKENLPSRGEGILMPDYNKLMITMKESMVAICSDAQTCCYDLVKQKVDEGSLDKLSANEFMELSKSIESFTLHCESVCGRRCDILKSVVMTQANKFASRFHEERKRKLISVLAVEQWKSLDFVPPDLQDLLDQIIEKGIPLNEVKRNTKSDTEPKKYLNVRGENMVVIASIKPFIHLILDYCQCTTEISSLSPDLLTRLIDLLKTFNDRCYSLVLKGEAVNESGLKSVSARTLFISWRCLQLIVILLPFIENHFCELLPLKLKSMVKNFNEVRISYEDHINKIPDKFLSLIKDLMTVNLSKWDAKPPVPSVPFQTISQHLMRLHENIQDTLPMSDLAEFFCRINNVFKDILRQQLIRLKITNDGGPQHGLVIQELTFYNMDLNNLAVGKYVKLSSYDLWATTIISSMHFTHLSFCDEVQIDKTIVVYYNLSDLTEHTNDELSQNFTNMTNKSVEHYFLSVKYNDSNFDTENIHLNSSTDENKDVNKKYFDSFLNGLLSIIQRPNWSSLAFRLFKTFINFMLDFIIGAIFGLNPLSSAIFL